MRWYITRCRSRNEAITVYRVPPSVGFRCDEKSPTKVGTPYTGCVHCIAKRKCISMRWSQYFVPTLREDPADAEVVSHKLLLRAGIVRQLSAGIYSYLPLGQRIALKVMQILREEMNRI